VEPAPEARRASFTIVQSSVRQKTFASSAAKFPGLRSRGATTVAVGKDLSSGSNLNGFSATIDRRC
jgi:hypothetical protein